MDWDGTRGRAKPFCWRAPTPPAHVPLAPALPQNDAQRLNNIRKALDVLRTRQGMPLKDLWREREILNGGVQVVSDIIMQARKVGGDPLRRRGAAAVMP